MDVKYGFYVSSPFFFAQHVLWRLRIDRDLRNAVDDDVPSTMSFDRSRPGVSPSRPTYSRALLITGRFNHFRSRLARTLVYKPTRFSPSARKERRANLIEAFRKNVSVFFRRLR